MSTGLPSELLSTLALVRRAYPDGISEEEYLPLLAIISQELSIRRAAQFGAHFFGKDPAVVTNDVLRVLAGGAVEPAQIAKMEEKLRPFGLDQWKNEK